MKDQGSAARDSGIREPETPGTVLAGGGSGRSPGGKRTGGKVRLPLGLAARLSRYLQVLTQARKMGMERISSHELADFTHVNSTQIRRDFSLFGRFGKRGVGYDIAYLIGEIRRIMHTADQYGIAVFGAGHLGQAIVASDVFADHGFQVRAAFDVDKSVIGTRVDSLTVHDISKANDVIAREDVVVGVIAVPDEAAQEVADMVVEAGVKIIFNYSGQLLQVPPNVAVHNSNPAADLLYALYYYVT